MRLSKVVRQIRNYIHLNFHKVWINIRGAIRVFRNNINLRISFFYSFNSSKYNLSILNASVDGMKLLHINFCKYSQNYKHFFEIILNYILYLFTLFIIYYIFLIKYNLIF